MATWHVTAPNSKKEVHDTRGGSKEEAQKAFIVEMAMLTGADKPWVWWEKQGYRLRRTK